MSEEKEESGMSAIKKAIIGAITTAVTAGGAWFVTHLGGGEETKEEVKTEQTAADICYDSCATMDLHNDAGITVSGSKSTQSFSTTYMGAMDPEKHSIVLKLLGETPDNRPVLKPVTVRAKPKCTTCGRQNKAHAKFCVECGTALEIFA